MTRADFTGPVRSNSGFEVGSGDNAITVIDSSGTIHVSMNIGTTAAPVEVIGNLTGDVTGDVTGNVTGNLTGNVTGTVSGNAGTVTNGVYTTGDQTIAGTKTFSATILGDVGASTAPANVYGYLSGAFLGNAAFATSTVTSTNLDAVTAGYFQIFYTSTGGLILATSTGTVGTITVT